MSRVWKSSPVQSLPPQRPRLGLGLVCIGPKTAKDRTKPKKTKTMVFCSPKTGFDLIEY
ncbi:hypothetical protein GALMADRAFT_149188 [Galerina marginata CBS 339.88]|uniref:Uncharacterized protein n=1 Tax=Galerina marginata (strain CBS 339.88) TaxID=685588 RepID=A0A067SAS9_GALM3|nr:hypothetical protein GALMADRAFT_149188 [Galerina marginata CBS 339.88]